MATLTTPFGNRRRSTTIDMTPMVDLAFLLLTFFVMTTTLNRPGVMSLIMPEKPTRDVPQPPINDKDVLNLVLGENNKIYWYMGIPSGQAETTSFSGSGIRKILSEKRVSVKNLYVLIKPSDQSQYKNVVDALDEIVITEIKRYAIVEMEAPDKQLLARN